jgi:hypothetical protein
MYDGPGWDLLHSQKDLDGKVLSYQELMEGFMREGKQRVGTAFHEAFKSPNEPSKVYEALLSCCKAAAYQMERNTNSVFKVELANKYSLDFFFPAVVLDGELIEAFLLENGDIEIATADYIPVEFNYNSNKYPKAKYYPDIVTVNGLNTYLEVLSNWAETIYRKTLDRLGK